MVAVRGHTVALVPLAAVRRSWTFQRSALAVHVDVYETLQLLDVQLPPAGRLTVRDDPGHGLGAAAEVRQRCGLGALRHGHVVSQHVRVAPVRHRQVEHAAVAWIADRRQRRWFFQEEDEPLVRPSRRQRQHLVQHVEEDGVGIFQQGPVARGDTVVLRAADERLLTIADVEVGIVVELVLI